MLEAYSDLEERVRGAEVDRDLFARELGSLKTQHMELEKDYSFLQSNESQLSVELKELKRSLAETVTARDEAIRKKESVVATVTKFQDYVFDVHEEGFN